MNPVKGSFTFRAIKKALKLMGNSLKRPFEPLRKGITCDLSILLKVIQVSKYPRPADNSLIDNSFCLCFDGRIISV